MVRIIEGIVFPGCLIGYPSVENAENANKSKTVLFQGK